MSVGLFVRDQEQNDGNLTSLELNGETTIYGDGTNAIAGPVTVADAAILNLGASPKISVDEKLVDNRDALQNVGNTKAGGEITLAGGTLNANHGLDATGNPDDPYSHKDLSWAVSSISGSGTINVNNYTTLNADVLTATDLKVNENNKMKPFGSFNVGTLNFTEGGKLNLHAGQMTIIGEEGLTVAASDIASSGKINLSEGATFAVANTLTFDDEGAQELETTGTVQAGMLNVISGKDLAELAVNGGKLVVLGDANAKTLTANGGTIELGGQGGTINAALKAYAAGSVAVTTGDWTLDGDLTAAENGSVKVGGGTTASTLTLNGPVNNSVASVVAVDNLASVMVQADNVLTTEPIEETEKVKYQAASGTDGAFNLSAGSKLVVNGLDKSISLTNATEIKTALVDGTPAGLVDFGETTISGVTPGTEVEYNKVVGITSDSLKETTVTATATEADAGLTGGFGKIVVTDATESTVVNVNGTLELSGTGSLIADEGGNAIGVNVDSGNALTVGGAGDGQLGNVALSGAGAILNVQKDGTVNVAGITGTGTVNAGNTRLTSEGDISVDTLNAAGSAIEAGTLTATGNLAATGSTIAAGKLNAGTLTATDSQLNVTGDMSVANLTATGSAIEAGTLTATGNVTANNSLLNVGGLSVENVATMNVLNSSLIVEKLQASSGMLILDPSYGHIDEVADGRLASQAGVGLGSVLEVGTVAGTQAAAQEMGFNPTALSTGGFTVADGKAMLALGQNITLTGKLLVDGSKDAGDITTALSGLSAGTATFADNSLLVVDGNIKNITSGAAALTATKVTVAEKAKLYVTNAKVGEYTIAQATGEAENSLDIAAGAWNGDKLGTDNKLVKAELKKSDDKKTAIVKTTANDAKSLMPGLDSELGALVNNMTNAKMTNQDSNNFGERFVNRAVNRLSGDAAAKTIEGAAKMAFAGAVPQMAAAVANSAASVATTRTSLASPLQDMGGAVAMTDEGVQLEGLSAGDGMKNGFGMWIMPMYQNQSAFGFDSGNFESGYKASFGGIALGADYTVNDAFRFGLSFNVGTGYADSTGDFNDTTNKFNYWGVGAYAGYKYGNFGLTADLGYTTTQNELEQDVPAALGMNKLEADTTATNLSAGLRGEYKVETSVLDIIPHVGVRVNSLHVKSFDVESAGRKVMKADDMNATVWQFPVGVTFSKDVKTDNGWTVRPQADLAVIPAAGDLEARQDVRLNGVPGSAEMDSNIMDSISGRASIGLEAKHDNGFSVGVNYSFQGSEHTADHGVQATFRYDF